MNSSYSTMNYALVVEKTSLETAMLGTLFFQ
ncbi:unnamed protein product, partial [marine sediment metagenome]